MARFTSLEFMESLGLVYSDYNGAKILLRLLAKKGLVKEVGKISLTGKGRPQVIYEIPEEITLNVKPLDRTPSHPPKKKKKVSEIVEEAVESSEEVAESPEVEEVVQEVEHEDHLQPVAAQAMKTSGDCEWDDGWEDD